MLLVNASDIIPLFSFVALLIEGFCDSIINISPERTRRMALDDNDYYYLQ